LPERELRMTRIFIVRREKAGFLASFMTASP